MLTCQEVTQLVTDFIEGRLSWWEALRFRAHLLMCAKCRTYVHQMRVTRETLGRLPPDSLSEEAQTELLEHFRAWRRADTP